MNRRHFLIGHRESDVPPTWKALEIGAPNSLLSHCPLLPVQRVDTLDGVPCVVLGTALQADPYRSSVADEIRSHPWSDLAALSHRWSGAWALVSRECLLVDAAGLFGVYSYRDPLTSDVTVSSSLDLLQRCNPEVKRSRFRPATYGLAWYPAPAGPLTGVRKLLPDQLLDHRDGSVTHCERSVCADALVERDVDELAADLLDSLAHLLSQVEARHGIVRIGLTAGLDSRTLLAAALHADIRVEAVSFSLPRGTRADHEVAGQMANDVGIPHSVLEPGRWSMRLDRLHARRTLGGSPDSRYLVTRGLLSAAPEGQILLIGNCFETGRNYYHSLFRGLEWADVVDDPAQLVQRFRDWGSTRELTDQISPWVSWRDQHPLPFSWKDAFYRDQRIGAWLSAAQQAEDLSDGQFFQPANSQHIYDLLLSAPEGDRKAGAVQHSMIERSGTGLHRFPFNPPDKATFTTRRRRLSRRCGRVVHEARNWTMLNVRGTAAAPR